MISLYQFMYWGVPQGNKQLPGPSLTQTVDVTRCHQATMSKIQTIGCVKGYIIERAHEVTNECRWMAYEISYINS